MRKVCCGAQFSVVLAFDGHVYTFGQGICWIYLSSFSLFQFCLASFWSSRASDWPAGFHAEEQIQPPGGPVPGGPVHRGHCRRLRTCASSVLHWRRLRLGLQQRGTGEPTSFLRPAAEHRNCFTSLLFFLWIQLGLGHCNPVKEPTLITALQGKNVKQISAGRCHSAAWTAPSTSKSSGTNLLLLHACI